MDLRFTPEELAFRDEVRGFFRTNLPESIRTKLVEGRRLAKDDIITWQRILNQRGWAVANWPVQWGGRFSRNALIPSWASWQEAL